MAKDKNNGGANLGFEADLWRAADVLRSNMDAAGRARQAGGEPFEEKMSRLTADLKKQMEEGSKLDKQIWKNLEVLGYGE